MLTPKLPRPRATNWILIMGVIDFAQAEKVIDFAQAEKVIDFAQAEKVIDFKGLPNVIDFAPASSSDDPPADNLFYLTNDDTKVVTVSVKKNSAAAPTLTLEISKDGKNWTTLGQTSVTVLSVEIPVGGKVYMRSATGTAWGSSYISRYNAFSSTGLFGAHGSIMELLGQTELVAYSCSGMFYGCTNYVGGLLLLPNVLRLY